MSASGVDQTVQFTFCPKCGAALADGRCAKCGWSLPPTASGTLQPRKRRRLELLIGALTLLVLVSVGLNTLLNFSSVVRVLPADVLLWMDGDGSGQVSTELSQRFRRDKLSKRQTSNLIEQRIMDSVLKLQSPFPVGLAQTMEIEHNCRVPGDEVSVRIENWKLAIDGKQIATAAEVPPKPQGFVIISTDGPIPPNARILPSRNERMQKIDLPALDAGVYRVEVAGQLTVRQAEPSGEELFARPITFMENVEIKGRLRDYVRSRTSERMLKVARNTCAALAFWTGDEDDNERTYTLKLGVASPEIPFVMSAWVRVGTKGEFKRIGTLIAEPRVRVMAMSHELSLADVPGISEARRIQVRLRPDLVTAIARRYKECFGGVVEWDFVPLSHRRAGYIFNPYTDDVQPPSRVKKIDDENI